MSHYPDVIIQIKNTLPPFVKERDRPFHFDLNGNLIYDHSKASDTIENNWEPPKSIDGFETDPNNPWILRPLWGYCEARMHTAIRFTSCGCLGLVTRCTEPRAHFMERVNYATCQECPFETSTKKE